ncbi:MAG TPA: amidase, partial [Rhodospirillales bacterium]|nr:amidase [Rhodospirillales bacterium]
MGSSITRRDLAKLALATAAVGSSARAAAAADPITAGGAIAAVRLAEGTLGARELAEAALERAGQLAHLGAFINLDPDQVRRDADRIDALRKRGGDPGPLAGVPLAVKDNIDSSALPTTAGTPALRDWRPRADAPVLAGLL